jgi:regulation of enolase protein 1 (concanavalin A-like superfamily)
VVYRLVDKRFCDGKIVLFNDDLRAFAAGIEVVDGTPFVSCVTTNVYSDWSTQKWNSYELHMRVHKLGESAVVEVENEKGMRS